MIIKNFTIPIFDIRVRLIETERNTKLNELKKHLDWIRPEINLREMIEDKIKDEAYNGGVTIFNQSSHEFLVLIYRPTSIKNRLNIIGHEKRHVEDGILDHCNIDDIETAGFLAGFLTEKMLYDGTTKS